MDKANLESICGGKVAVLFSLRAHIVEVALVHLVEALVYVVGEQAERDSRRTDGARLLVIGVAVVSHVERRQFVEQDTEIRIGIVVRSVVCVERGRSRIDVHFIVIVIVRMVSQ